MITMDTIPYRTMSDEIHLSMFLNNIEVMPMGEITILLGGLKFIAPLFHKTETIKGWTVIKSSVLVDSPLISEKEKKLVLSRGAVKC